MNKPLISSPGAEQALAPTWAEVDLNAVRHNARLLLDRAGAATFIAVVKADAYGHGAVRVTQALQREGIRWFAVATVPEAVQLREAGIRERILVFGNPLPAYLPAYSAHDLDLTIGSEETAAAVAASASRSGPFRVHLEVDTGMTRLGVSPVQVQQIMRLLERAQGVEVVSIWTHLATSDERGSGFLEEQHDRFTQAVAPIRDSVQFVHTANSGGLLGRPELFAHERSGVRIGIALYGYPPAREMAGIVELQPAMSFKTRVIRTVVVPPETTVSYNRTWASSGPTRIVTLAAGYADGYPRVLSNRAWVGVAGREFPVRGTVCMDMTMAEETGAGEMCTELGDEAVLFGRGGPAAMDVAEWAGTITYELCCAVGKRVPRIYIE